MVLQLNYDPMDYRCVLQSLISKISSYFYCFFRYEVATAQCRKWSANMGLKASRTYVQLKKPKRYVSKQNNCSLNSDLKWMFLYKWPMYDYLCPFFAICMFIFHKTEGLMVILRCLTGLNLDWLKSYGLRCSLRPHASSANFQNIVTDK